ncbi:hypothetical protein [Salmonella enterica]|uniref:hypothetical protein n=1 Tax=Salmonella enterica TaxID=28901 RepID=UPI0020167718|nr:hypothetical protein [Salmonella enterica]MCT6965405.1 hypothetical protein [Salmonella enterica subsp. enterica serovar Oranienburg]MCT7008515.1 hypothetical protein [Salmonella enterica subsp. enterica serovar Oranienburg]MCT7084103.1 hypothetical protein [Salmonella enterica subsp. enterica serovar Oranienburg]MCT7092663.1 hypothetical protein [Salmonella enterica subsp. enterica serovar Oranienburg]MCT7119820.1 hypothetical protein [Salmonella enterica subsp. enterica serovar Oranienbur
MMVPVGDIQVGFLWPGKRFQLVALAAGIPCMGMQFIYPLRDRWLAFSRANYVLILVALEVMAVTDLKGLMIVPPGHGIWGASFCVWTSPAWRCCGLTGG